ncbi:trypsin-like peptidase domain-containing protein [Candidatus Bathyarchaeota archaeon]|nr:trypsin-like peptidase domain-containing protein [Candidatus Bathyarchaeota archaeon]
MKNLKAIGLAMLLMLFVANYGMLDGIPSGSAATTSYSTGLIAELGEASTMLIYSTLTATVNLPVPDANMNPTATIISVLLSVGVAGSGFFVASTGYVATAGHVVYCFTQENFAQDPDTRIFVMTASFDVLLQALQQQANYNYNPAQQAALLAYMQTNGQFQSTPVRVVYAVLGQVEATLTEIEAKGWVARVVTVSPYIERDLALLKVEGLTNCPVLTIGDSDKVSTGYNVYMFGFPDVISFQLPSPQTLLAPLMTSGIISAERITNFDTPCFQTDAAITHGMSGGPGLDANGEVIGICSRGSISEAMQEAAGFNFLIQSNVLKSLLTESSVANTKGPVDEAFLKGLNYYYEHHYSAAKTQFETVTGLFPYHWRAKDLILNCNAAIARGEDVPLGLGMETLIPLIAFIAGIVVVAVVVVILFQRRKMRTTTNE